MRCARCWSKDWASSRTKLWELPLRSLGLTPLRCGGCGRRDYRGPVDFQIRLRLRIPSRWRRVFHFEPPRPRIYRYPRTSPGRFARGIRAGTAWLERIHISSPRRFYRRCGIRLEAISAATRHQLKAPSRMLQRALDPKPPKATVANSPTNVARSVHERASHSPKSSPVQVPDPSTRDAA